MFESNPDFSDNTYPVYVLLKKFLPDYKMVWTTKHYSPNIDALNDADDIVYIEYQNVFEWLKYLYYCSRCRAMICCNIIPRKLKKSQLLMYLGHGSETKRVKEMLNINNLQVDYVNLQSHCFDESSIDNINCSPDKFVYLGYPRCDYFYKSDNPEDIEQIITGEKFKFIIWLPTFRGHRSGTRDDAPDSVFNKIGIPLIYSIESLREFNNFLRDKNIHIIYKPHPAQDLDVVKKETLSNFHLIYDSDILSKKLQLYQIIAQSEALITDYSSVFWDYLLLDKPIAVTTDDLANWSSGRGFVIDIEAIHDKIAEKVFDSRGLCEFITGLLDGRDPKQQTRREVRDIANIWKDGNSAMRTVNFIMQKLKERYPDK